METGVKGVVKYLKEGSEKINEENIKRLDEEANDLITSLIKEMHKNIKPKHLSEGCYVFETTQARLYKRLEDKNFRQVIRSKAHEIGFEKVSFEKKRTAKTWALKFTWFDSHRYFKRRLHEILEVRTPGEKSEEDSESEEEKSNSDSSSSEDEPLED